MKNYNIGQELGLVKTYTGKDMPEAMMKLRHDLGVDAMILDQQERWTPGWLGFLPFGKEKYVEITACPNLKAQKNKGKSPVEEPIFTPIKRGVQIYRNFSSAGTLASESPPLAKGDSNQVSPLFSQPPNFAGPGIAPSARRPTLEEIRSSLSRGRGDEHEQGGSNRSDRTDLLDIEAGSADKTDPPSPEREAVKGMIRETAIDCRPWIPEIAGLKNDIEELKRLVIESAVKGFEGRKVCERFRDIRRRLERSEFVKEHISDLISNLEREISEEERDDQKVINSFVFSTIMRKVKSSKPISLKGREPKIVAITGPTGVGKTTTLAKLAAHFWLTNKSRIAFITIDTFRIGAPVQLEKFGEILGVQTHTVFDPKELNAYIQLLTEEGIDLIFIDTFGASPSDTTKIIEMKAYLSSIEGLQTLLAVSATTKYKDLLEIVAAFGKIGFSEMIFTKMDETSIYGPILSLLLETRVPLIYTTCGQEAVGNFNEANVRTLVSKAILAKKSKFGRDRPVQEIDPPATTTNSSFMSPGLFLTAVTPATPGPFSPGKDADSVSKTRQQIQETGQNGSSGHGHARIRDVIFPTLD